MHVHVGVDQNSTYIRIRHAAFYANLEMKY